MSYTNSLQKTPSEIKEMPDQEFARWLPEYYAAFPALCFKEEILSRASRLQIEQLSLFMEVRLSLKISGAPYRAEWAKLVRQKANIPTANQYVPADERPDRVRRRAEMQADVLQMAKAMGYADGRIPASAFQHLTQQPEPPIPKEVKQPINASFPDPDRNPQPTTAQPIKVPPGWRKE